LTHLFISTTGQDAAWFDHLKLHGHWSGLIGQWGNKGGKGYCLSSDPKDAKPWVKKVDKSFYRKIQVCRQYGESLWLPLEKIEKRLRLELKGNVRFWPETAVLRSRRFLLPDRVRFGS
jgi:hypothetical protein